MSIKTAQYAVDTQIVTQDDDAELGYEMLALLEAVDFDYEQWCMAVMLDPDSQQSNDVYDLVLHRYADVWKTTGNVEFGRLMKERVAHWEEIVHGRSG